MASLFGRGFNPLHLHTKRCNFCCTFFGGMGGLNLIIFYFFCPSISTKKVQLRLCPFWWNGWIEPDYFLFLLPLHLHKKRHNFGCALFCVYDHILGLETAAWEKKSCIFCFSPATMMMSSSWMMRLGSGLV